MCTAMVIRIVDIEKTKKKLEPILVKSPKTRKTAVSVTVKAI